MRGICRGYRSGGTAGLTITAADDRAHALINAANAREHAIALRDVFARLRAIEPVVPVLESASGRFRDWYRGDRKIGIRDLISRLEERCDIR